MLDKTDVLAILAFLLAAGLIAWIFLAPSSIPVWLLAALIVFSFVYRFYDIGSGIVQVWSSFRSLRDMRFQTMSRLRSLLMVVLGLLMSLSLPTFLRDTDGAVIFGLAAPMLLILGEAGLVDPRLPGAIYPGAEHLPRVIRVVSSVIWIAAFVLGICSFLVILRR